MSQCALGRYDKKMTLWRVSVLLLCVFLPCIHASWEHWQSWTACTESCNGGTQTRHRTSYWFHKHDSQTDDCNEFCYNSGHYSKGRACGCQSGTHGSCCENYRSCVGGVQYSFWSHRLTTRCKRCADQYYIADWGSGCAACSSIQNCAKRQCTSATDQTCVTCTNDRVFFDQVNSNRNCGRLCASNRHYCWPGRCGDKLTEKCVCTDNFRKVADDRQTKCEPNLLPTFQTCRMTVTGNDGDKVTSPVSGHVTSCDNQKDFYGNFYISSIEYDIFIDYVMETSAFGPKPGYIVETNFGVTDVAIKVTRHPITGASSTVENTALLVDRSRSVDAKPTMQAKGNITVHPLTIPLKDGESLCMDIEAKGGGHLKSKDMSSPSHSTSIDPYQKRQKVRSLCYMFDNTPPRHCQETGCTKKTISMDTRVMRSFDIDVTFTGWIDVIPPGGSGIHASGIQAYVLTVNDVISMNGTLKVNTLGGNILQREVGHNVTSLSLSLPVEQARLYCLTIGAVDVAKNQKTARRFLLVDNSSFIETGSEINFRVASASQYSLYNWQTHHNDLCLTWKDYFRNKDYDNNFLNPIERGSFSGVYEQETGVLPVSGTENVHGITGFKLAWQLNGGSVTKYIPVTNFTKQEICQDLHVQDGQTFTLYVQANDIVGNTLEDNRTVHIDRSVPHINNMWLIKDDHKQLFVHSSKDLAYMELYFEAMDPHSGIRTVEWAVAVQDTAEQLMTGTLGVTNLDNLTTCSHDVSRCYCPSVGPCQMFNYSVTLNDLVNLHKSEGDHNRNYVFSINVTNQARLSTIEHFDVLVDDSPPVTGVVFEGPVDSPDVDYTSGDEFIANWQGFIDHESGVKLYRIGLATRCLSKKELYNWNEAELSLNTTEFLLRETTDSQIRLPANFTGRRYVSVSALNNAMEPSDAVCSDGITVDTSPPAIENFTIENGHWEERIGCFEGRAWLFRSGLTKVMLHDTSTCQNRCAAQPDETQSSLLPIATITKLDPDMSEFMCQQLQMYTEESATVFLPADRLYLTWDVVEDLSQIHEIYVGLGRDQSEGDDPKLLGYMETKNRNVFKYNHIGIGSDEIFYIFIKTENKAGLQTVSRIGPVLIDQTPPLFKEKPSVTIETDVVTVGWDNDTFYDIEQETPIKQVTLQFGQSNEKVSPMLEWKQGYSTTCTNFTGGCIQYPLEKLQRHDTATGKPFYADIYIINNAGHTTHLQTALFNIPSRYPPGHALIWDLDPSCTGCHGDVDYHFTDNTLCASWEGFYHHEDVQLEFAIGTSKKQDDILPFRPLSPLTTRHCENMTSHPDAVYYISVRASCSGGKSVSSSDGVRIIDTKALQKHLHVYNGKDCSTVEPKSVNMIHRRFTKNTTISINLANTIEGRIYSVDLSGTNLSSELDCSDEILVEPHSALKDSGSLRFEIWPTSQTVAQCSIHSNRSGYIDTVVLKECSRVHRQYTVASSELTIHWSLPLDFQVYMSYEVALFRDTCPMNAVSYSCLTIDVPFQAPNGNMSHVFLRHNVQHNNTYRAAVRPCINTHCLNYSISDRFITDTHGPQPGNVRATAVEPSTTCLNFTATFSAFDSLSPLVFYQWAVLDGQTSSLLFSPWTTIVSSDTLNVSDCMSLPVYPYRSLSFCVRGYSESGISGVVCTKLHTGNLRRTKSVLEISSQHVNWPNIKSLLHSDNAGSLTSLMYDSELDFGNQSTHVTGFILYGAGRTIEWYLMKEAVNPKSCTENTLCVFSKRTDTGFIEIPSHVLSYNTAFFICAYSKEENVSRESSTEVLEELDSCSDGFILDNEAPVAGTVHVVAIDNYITVNSSIAFSWTGFVDATHSSAIGYRNPIQLYNYFIGSQPYASDIKNSTCVYLSTSSVARGLSLTNGKLVYVSVEAVDQSGHSTLAVSKPVIVDTTPPITGQLDMVTSSLHRHDAVGTAMLEVRFIGFMDTESGIRHFVVSVGSSPYQADVMSPSTFTRDTLDIDLGEHVLDGHVYYTSVRAVNGAGLYSSPVVKSFVLDVTEPVGGFVIDGHVWQDDIDFQTETHSIGGHWFGFNDPHTGIVYYRAGMGSKPLLDDIEPLTDVGLTKEMYWNTTFSIGVKYYLTVSACNGAGLCRTVSSDGVLIDNSPPISGIVTVGSRDHSHHYQPRRTSLHMAWTGFEDPQSQLDHFSACVGTLPYKCDIIPEFNCLLQSFIVKSNLNLPVNVNLYTTVTAFNKANLTTSQSSDWFRVDDTEPILVKRPKFSTLSGQSVQWERSILHLTWEFRDDECPIHKHTITLATHHEGHTPVEHVDLGAETELTVNLETNEALKDGDSYSFVVTACNIAGLCTSAQSDQLRIDSTPPHLGGFKPPLTWNNLLYTDDNLTSTVHLTWYGFSDPESGIKNYYITVGRNYSSQDLSDGVTMINNTGDDGTENIATINLTDVIKHGEKIVVSVWAENNAGLISSISRVTAIAISTTATGIDKDKKGILELEKHSCDVHFCNKDCTCAVVGKPCTNTVTSMRCEDETNSTMDGFPRIQVFGGTRSSPSNVTSSSTCLAGYWDVFPRTLSNVTIHRYEWSLGKHGDPIGYGIFDLNTEIPWRDVGMRQESVHCIPSHRKTGLEHDTDYTIYVKAWFSDSQFKVYTSETIHTDHTPPSIRKGGSIKDSDDGCRSDRDFVDDIRTMTACWKGVFRESQTAITHYMVSLGSEPGGSDIHPWTNVLLTTNYSVSNLSLFTPGTHLYFTVRAVNSVGLATTLTSDGFVIDRAPPIEGVVFNTGRHRDRKYQSSRTTFSISWHGFTDLHSGIRSYSVALVQCDQSIIKEDFVNVGPHNTYTFGDIILDQNTAYCGLVKAEDGAGHFSASVLSNPAVIDATPPIPFYCETFELIKGSTTNDTGTITTISLVTDQLYFVNGTVSNISGDPFVDISVDTDKVSVPAVLNNDGSLWYQYNFLSRFQGPVNISVHMNSVLSQQFRVLSNYNVYICTGTVDTSNGSVEVTQIGQRRLAITLYVKDQESGISRVLIGAGTHPGSFQIRPLTSVKLGITNSISVDVPHAARVYVTSVAENNAGVRTRLPSVSVVFDMTSPAVSQLVTYISDVSSHNGTHNILLTASWLAEDEETGIEHCFVGVGRKPGSSDVVSLFNTGVIQSFKTNLTSLPHGTELYVIVKCINSVQLSTEVVSPAMVVSYDKPSSASASVTFLPVNRQMLLQSGTMVDDVVQSNTSLLQLTWHGFTDISGIQGYEYRLLTDNRTVIDWTNAGLHNMVVLDHLTMKNGNSYRAGVRSINRGLQYSDAVYTDIIVDSRKPTLTDHHIRTVTTGNQLTLDWSNVFSLDEHIDHVFSVAIGSAFGFSDIADVSVTMETSLVTTVPENRNPNIHELFVSITCTYSTGMSTIYQTAYKYQ